MKRVLHIYLSALKISFATRMAYRADFFVSTLIILISELGLPFITLLIYETGSSFPDWSLHETLLLQGTFMLSRGIANLTFFGIVWNTLSRVREGTYDLLMIKPCSVLFLSLAGGFEPDSIGTISGGILVTVFSLSKIPAPGLINWAGYFMFLIFSLLVLFSFALIMAGSLFKWVGNSRIYEIFDSVASFGNYPRSIFSKSFQAILSYIVPVAAIGFFPASALLGKATDNALAVLLVCLIFLAFSLFFWNKMLSSYTSAGG